MNATDDDPGPKDAQDPVQGEPSQPAPGDGNAAEAGQDLLSRVRRAEEAAEEQRNAYLRAAAELENVRKRAAREVESARQYGAEGLASGLLPVLDSLELGLASAEKADAATLLEGQRATLRLLLKALEAAGITEIDPAGLPFDPERHEAMAMQPSAEHAPDTVVAVVQKGYLLNGRLLRPARVLVARAPDA